MSRILSLTRGLALAILGLIMAQVGLTGCTRNVHGGDPALPLSNASGSERSFDFSDAAVNVAITNAFEGPRYRGMTLEMAKDDANLIPNWSPTNGFVLFPLMGPITNVPLAGNTAARVPYKPYFYIITVPAGQTRTKVCVRTIKAKVVDGQETSVHGGWADHERTVSPVRAEEERVLDEIANLLRLTTNQSR